MVILGTFDYVVQVPDPPERLNRPWPVRHHSHGSGGDGASPGFFSRLLGTPNLRIIDAGPTPKAGWYRGRWLPDVQRALITISSRTSFYVAMDFVRSLRCGDSLYLALTPCAGMGLSVIRDETLVAAAGAVTAVPLGRDLVVRHPEELRLAVEALFEEVDPDYQPPDMPIEIQFEGQRHLVYRGTRDLGPYRIYMIHGFLSGMPGTDECLAISRSGFSETATNSTAQLLGGGDFERGG
jgi:hypothetical protein